MIPDPRSPRRSARIALAIAAAGAGVALAASASAASAACTAPASDAPGGKCRITFTSSGTFSVPAGVTSADVLVVGGGGGGGQAGAYGGSGGGQVVLRTSYGVEAGAAVPVAVGAGGSAAIPPAEPGPGGTSSFGSLTAAGGGASSSPDGAASGTFVGGTGGLAAGGVGALGGGGAGAAGNGISASANGNTPLCGAGGPGFDASGSFPGLSPAVFGGGGGGAVVSLAALSVPACAGGTGGGGAGGQFIVNAFDTLAQAGQPNTGGGAGALNAVNSNPGAGAAGGSGVVVVQYSPAQDSPAAPPSNDLATLIAPATVKPVSRRQTQVVLRLRFAQSGRYTMYAQTATGKRITLQPTSYFGNKKLTKAGGSIVRKNVKVNEGIVFGALVNVRLPRGSIVRLVLRQPSGTLLAQAFPLN